MAKGAADAAPRAAARAVTTPETRVPSWTALSDVLLEREARIAQANGAAADPLAGLVLRDDAVDRLVTRNPASTSADEMAAAFAALVDEARLSFVEALDGASAFAEVVRNAKL